jgi:aldehyde dehydrogenase (NAD+)
MTLPHYQHRIGGRDEASASGEYLASDNPFTGQDWCQIARGQQADVDRAVAAAKAAQVGWAAMSASKRGAILMRLADFIEAEGGALAELEVRDNGKLYKEMLAQMGAVASWYRYFGGMADKIEGAIPPAESTDRLNMTIHEPLGVIGMITPWNSPLLLLSNKLAPALAAGNAAVIKPSEFTSVSTLAFVALLERAGLPPGVANVVTGLGAEAGAALVAHPDVAKIAFTGSEGGGQRIYKNAARDLKLVSLELGGKSPNIVFEDADLEAAAMGAVTGIFSAAGQSCIAGSRLLLHRSIHDQVVARVVEVAARARLGDPMDPATNMGPIATLPQYEKVLSYLDIARADGARCVLGGAAFDGPGCQQGRFVSPTVFVGVTNTMRIAREEVFGPVLSVIAFDTEEEAVAIANDTPYGLGSGVWSRDIGKALRVAKQIKAGQVWVNNYRYGSVALPFGGYKRSGIGREGGIDGMKAFLQVKTISVLFTPAVNDPFVMQSQ